MNYYTPELEEFHYNFPYEQKAVTGGWREMEFSFNLKKIKSYLEQGRIRVKHLDRDDVESCGWEYQPDRDNLEMFYDKETGTHSIIHNKINGWVLITLRNKIRKEDHTAFTGTIKNKSELKRILKQVGI